MHEDWESVGYYLYELNPEQRPTLAEPIIAAVTAVCPIDHSPLIDGRESKAGILRPVADPLLREKWPESIYLRATHTKQTYTLESPSAFPLAQRIAAHRVALETAISLTIRDWRRMSVGVAQSRTTNVGRGRRTPPSASVILSAAKNPEMSLAALRRTTTGFLASVQNRRSGGVAATPPYNNPRSAQKARKSSASGAVNTCGSPAGRRSISAQCSACRGSSSFSASAAVQP